MHLLTKRKSRATRRAEAHAMKAKAKAQARLAAKNETRRIASAERIENKTIKARRQAQKDADHTAIKVAQAQLKTVREGTILSPHRIKRLLTVSRLLAPIIVPVIYRIAIAVRGIIDERRARRLGVPLSQVGQFSGHGGRLSARIVGVNRALTLLINKNPKNAEINQFVAAMNDRLTGLRAAITAAENMPHTRRRSTYAAISQQLDDIDADLLTRLEVL